MAGKVIATIVRIALGALFFYSGAMKAGDPRLFALDVQNFDLVPWRVALVIACFLPWLEIVAGLALVTRRLAAGGLALVAAMNLCFTAALASAWARGLEIRCGCYGETDGLTNYPLHLLANTAMIAAAVWLLRRESRAGR